MGSVTYEQSVRRVEAIVADLGIDAKPLSEALTPFEEAAGCLQNASEQFSVAEVKVLRVLEASDGGISVRDL
jgi:exonuclease VII small subunit